jgi:adhesin/invasin
MAARGILNAASYSVSAPLSPGSIISISGSDLANGTSSTPTPPLGTQLSGTLVIIGGRPAPLIYAGQGQIYAIIPYGLPVNTQTQVIVQQGNAYTTPEPITLASAQPAFFTEAQNGTGQAIVVRPEDGELAEPGSPAQSGDEVVFYGTGMGDVTPTAVAGQAASSSPLMSVSAPVSMSIGGQTAAVKFAGLVPGFTGLYEVNAIVPAGVTGDSVAVVLTVAGQPSPTVTMAVK